MKTVFEVLIAFGVVICGFSALYGLSMIITKTTPDNLSADDYVKHKKEQLDI